MTAPHTTSRSTRPARPAVRAWLARALVAGMAAACGIVLAQPASAPQAAGTTLAQPSAPPQVVQLGATADTDALVGYWFLPRESAPPRMPGLPVVVALHGCGGLHETSGKADKTNRRRDKADARVVSLADTAVETPVDPAPGLQARYREYAHWLNARGYAVLMPDSFGPRGRMVGLCSEALDTRGIDDKTRRGDALAALRWLARQPGIDTSRIVLLGWSNGAQAVLAAIDASRPWPRGTPAVERAVAFYPGCKRAVQQHDYRLRAPVLLMIGGADDWTPATRCAMLQNAVQARQPDARFRLEIYPGAYHGFDGTSELHVRRDVPAARQGRGVVTVGGDAIARVAALARLDAWLASPDP